MRWAARATLLCPQLFAGDVLKMFSTDCKRMSAEIFDQTMPLGKHWRVGLRAGGWGCPGAGRCRGQCRGQG